MQNHYNLAYREEERETLPLCQKGIGVMPWSPLARGYLTRPHEDVDATLRGETEEHLYEHPYREGGGLAVNERVAELADEKGVKMAQIALAWLFHKEWVDTPIVGTTSVEHLEDAVEALDIDLSKSDMEWLEEPYEPVRVSGHESEVLRAGRYERTGTIGSKRSSRGERARRLRLPLINAPSWAARQPFSAGPPNRSPWQTTTPLTPTTARKQGDSAAGAEGRRPEGDDGEEKILPRARRGDPRATRAGARGRRPARPRRDDGWRRRPARDGGGGGGNPFAQMMSGMMGGGGPGGAGGPPGMGGGGPGGAGGRGEERGDQAGNEELVREVRQLRDEVRDATRQLQRIAQALEDD